MKALGLNEIREKFLSFFESKEHLRMSSFPLVPQNDKSLLLINSGMAPLKPYFTGQEIPPRKRVTTCQKCIRTGDIENVGKTARHGTFFEMLGNFSFGDYFKEEVIPWSWEFVTEVMEIPTDRLYISIYKDDDEAFEIWNKKVGIPKERIFRMGKEDNFWEVGLGPCGPCSEIYFDKGEKYGCGKEGCTVGCDCDRYMEFWNLVFTQFNKEETGEYTDLPNPNIDTGMGLERIAAMMQDVDSIFDVDTIKAIRDKVCQLAGIQYNVDPKKDVSIRIITDHVRSMTFMAADGILPSNEGRGYILKRLLRRAARHGKILGIDRVFLEELCSVVIDVSKVAYPELIEKQDYIFKVISTEENRFYQTIDQGIELLRGFIKKMKEERLNILNGDDAFKLYDTYGFPLELTREILEEELLSLDEIAFNKNMEAQRERARSAREESNYMGADETVYHKVESEESSVFAGYDVYEVSEANIIAIATKTDIVDEVKQGDEVSIILDKTPFYAESGGQRGDKGIITTESGKIEIHDCIKVVGNRIAHIGIVAEGVVKRSQKAKASIDVPTRMATSRNHSATHLLQKALREVLGTHVEQAGSYVTEDKLRFDFTHFSSLTREELAKVETIVNNKILESLNINICETTIDRAREMGAMALFGEKYGESVRVVDMQNFSVELCGGAHVSNTSQIGTFKIISEASAAAGVRRIEALTGFATLEYYRSLEEKIQVISEVVKSAPNAIVNNIKTFVNQIRELNKQNEILKARLSKNTLGDIIDSKEEIEGFSAVLLKLQEADADTLRNLGDQIKDKIKSGVIVLIGISNDKANMIVMATEDAVKAGINSGDIVKNAVASMGGKGGGRPNMAMAGGKDISKADDALTVARQVIKEQLSKNK